MANTILEEMVPGGPSIAGANPKCWHPSQGWVDVPSKSELMTNGKAECAKRMGGILNDIFMRRFWQNCPKEWLPKAKPGTHYHSLVRSRMAQAPTANQMRAMGSVAEFTEAADADFARFQTNSSMDTILLGADDPPDLGWMQVFAMHDDRNTGQSGFKIRNVDASAVTFKIRAVGEPTQYYKLGSGTTEVIYERYSGGFVHDKFWFDRNDGWWDVAREADVFSKKYFRDQANTFYGLLVAAAADATLFNTSLINTINLGIEEMITELVTNDNYQNMTPYPTIALIYKHSDAATIAPVFQNPGFQWTAQTGAATDAMLQASNLIWNVVPIRTMTGLSGAAGGGIGNALAANTALLVMPGMQIQGGIAQDLTTFNEHDPSTNTIATTGHGYYAGAVAQASQIRTITLS